MLANLYSHNLHFIFLFYFFLLLCNGGEFEEMKYRLRLKRRLIFYLNRGRILMWGHVASNLWQGCSDYEKDDYGHETLSWILVQDT